MAKSRRYVHLFQVLRLGLVSALMLPLALCCSSPELQFLEPKPVACDNLIIDGDETDVDCGGKGCPACPDDKHCQSYTDCESGSCAEGLCHSTSCTNGRLDTDESDIDCGGACPACDFGKACQADEDCVTATCIEGLCERPTCGDTVQNQDESDIDCGGNSGCEPCGEGSACEVAEDCESLRCVSYLCGTASCEDDVLNQDESDVDCGGFCSPCAAGARCRQPVDCESGVCADNECLDAACDDGVENGAETDTDCGGGSESGCDVCPIGAKCAIGSDCENGVCSSEKCQDAECVDGILNGEETDTDCGGSCERCKVGSDCVEGTDCESGVCVDEVCQEPACDDEVQNQDETDTDCGGSCGGCPTGRACSAGSDCDSGVCDNASCAEPSCSDETENGDESDVDCGGSCDPCSPGEQCGADDDCDTGLCEEESCTYSTSCADLLDRASAPETGVYRIDPSGVSPFTVFCDMTSGGGGWTRVAHEPSGAGGQGIQGALGLLGAEVGDPDVVAAASGVGNIGPRFNGMYEELRITWGEAAAQMGVGENIFADTVRTSIALTGVTTSDDALRSAIQAAGGAVFCRAHTSTAHPGDTSWAVKPVTSTDNTCGCSGMDWSGEGLFYGGAIPADTCEPWGGGWAGFCAQGEVKAALESTVALSLWVR